MTKPYYIPIHVKLCVVIDFYMRFSQYIYLQLRIVAGIKSWLITLQDGDQFQSIVERDEMENPATEMGKKGEKIEKN